MGLEGLRKGPRAGEEKGVRGQPLASNRVSQAAGRELASFSLGRPAEHPTAEGEQGWRDRLEAELMLEVKEARHGGQGGRAGE